jgi:tetrahydromethanopterin S-methyltransferase subunit E
VVPPLVGVAVKLTLVPAQMVVADADTDTLAGKFGFTVIVTPLDVAGDPVKHGLALDVSPTVTTSLLFSVVVVNVLLLVPALVPFTFHWYVGVVPPLVGVAVNVTLVPEHIVVADADTDTLAGKFGFTVMVIPVDVAGEPVKHGLAFEVSCTVTTSLLFSVVVVNVLLLVPTLVPFTFHW